MQNLQAPEKRVISDGQQLAVNSMFHTIQGEGPFAGSPATFIRLAGCNLQCPLCDTEYTNRLSMGIDEIFEQVFKCTPSDSKVPELVVITGGEPFRQSIGPLIEKLLSGGFRVQIETNGTLYQKIPFEADRLTIVCSPKAGSINKKLMPHIDVLKYVATVESLIGSSDGLPAHALEHPCGGHLARPPDWWKGDIYLQPVDESMRHGKRFNYKDKNFAPDEEVVQSNKANLEAVVQSCLKYGHRLCIQIHKLAGLA